ncbi:MAG: enoyl-CoA hydratase/isomerase family protein [Saprospirales bacterium]|nr:MAG: enoyl-CoA hydratase/isomerase family protein [Saprospirales bacterium]
MSKKQSIPYVETKIDRGVAVIEFFHPSHNALPGDILAKLSEQILKAGRMEEVMVILLKSGGDRTFCAGASFDELIAIEDGVNGKKFFMGFANVINAIRKCGKLVIGRVQGKAVGGGVGVLSACDHCFATRYASIRLSELAVGIGPFVIGPAVSRKTGLSAFSEMSLTPNEWQSAEYAAQKGLFNAVFNSTEQMDEAIDKFLDEMRGYNPAALNQLKSIFWKDAENWDSLLEERATISGQLVLSDFSKKTIAAFKEAARKKKQ